MAVSTGRRACSAQQARQQGSHDYLIRHPEPDVPARRPVRKIRPPASHQPVAPLLLSSGRSLAGRWRRGPSRHLWVLHGPAEPLAQCRLTGLGVNRTPVSRSITSATWGALQTSPSKPWAAGPCRSACSISGSWRSGITGPRALRYSNPAAPPARQRARQLTAVWRATPSCRATEAAEGPASNQHGRAPDASGPTNCRRFRRRRPAAEPQTAPSGLPRTARPPAPEASGPWRRCWPPSEGVAEGPSRLAGGRQVRANDAERMASWSRAPGGRP